MNTLSAKQYRPVRLVISVVIAATIVVTAMACTPSGGTTASPTKPGSSERAQAGQGFAVYDVIGARTFADVNAIAATGASVDGIEDGRVAVTAVPSEVSAVRRLGFRVELVHTPPAAPAGPTSYGFPPADAAYHDYDEMITEINSLVDSKPAIAQRRSIGRSYEGRDMPVIKISDNVAVDESEAEVLFDAHQHAREHLTVEMALDLLHLFIENYGLDPRITNIVDNREIWIVPDMNPDGGAYDIASGVYQNWRKNLQPKDIAFIGAVGTDLNRNWSYKWGCCGGSSGDAGSTTYRGPSAFSAPETVNLKNFVDSRVVGGTQQIKVNIDFHTYSQLVLWPYGYTTDNTTDNLRADAASVFATIGQEMAATNGFTPEQVSDLYTADGALIDWLWATHGIFAYSFELYPTSSAAGGFYPPANQIAAQTSINHEAVLILTEYANCPYRAISKHFEYCGALVHP